MTASPLPADYPAIINALTAGQTLAAAQMQAMMRGILSGEWTPVQTAAALTALKIKGETPSEISAAALMMREFSAKVEIEAEEAADLVDSCGTGGDGGRTFNISTAAAFAAAAAGARVAKHGNRAMSGASGSSDVLEQLGMPLTLTPAQVAEQIRAVGIGFMFAPNHHPAMKHAAPVRRELGMRTLFNLLGPLTNPAGARRQVVGVFAPELLLPYAETLQALGAEHALVVHGDGLDEITLSGVTDIAEVKDGAVLRRSLAPEDVGLASAPLAAIQAASAEESKNMLLAVMDGAPGAPRDVVVLNAAAVLIVAGKAEDFADGAQQAAQAIDSGAARRKLDSFIAAAKAAAAAQ